MKADLPALWAESPGTLRREPTPAELAGGFPCGDLDIQLFNEWFYRTTQMYRELSYAIAQSGQTPSANNLTQVWAAMRSASPDFSYGVAGGTPTALTVAATIPTIRTPYREGAVVLVRLPPGLAMGANARITVGPNGVDAPILRSDATPVQKGDGPADSFFEIVYLGGNWRLLDSGQAEVLKLPSLNKTFYVRPDGNDDNDGLTNTSTGAVKTIDAALALTRSYFSSAGTITIKLGVAGTYDWPRNLPGIRNDITILGDFATPSSYIISGTGPTGGGRGLIEANAGTITLAGLNILNTSGINSHAAASGGGSLFVDRCIFSGSVPNNGALVYAAGSSVVTFANAVTFGTPGANMIGVRNGQITFSSNTTITISGTPNYSDAVVSALDGGNVFFRAGCTRVGNATGRKYYLAGNGIYRTAALGTNFPPGNQDGFAEDVGSKYYP